MSREKQEELVRVCLALLEEFDGLDEDQYTFIPLPVMDAVSDLNALLEEQGWR